MHMNRELSQQFNPVAEQVKQTFNSANASGGAVLLIHKDKIVVENYWGKHSNDPEARNIQADTQFHVASVRKSYIGYAVAYAVTRGFIDTIDDEVIRYLPHLNENIFKGTTIRHLLTHTHGLRMEDNRIVREFSPGENWAYRGVGIDTLTQIIFQTTGQSVAEILSEQLFQPLEFKESGWYAEENPKLVEVIREPDQPHWVAGESTDGSNRNMYVSARELAFWGYIHLKEGLINQKQIVPKEIIKLATTIHSPNLKDTDNPQNGFLWFVKDAPAKRTEIGDSVPPGSFQILGYTNVALLVIPQQELVAVRMMNSFGSSEGFDYLADIRNFGDTVMKCC